MEKYREQLGTMVSNSIRKQLSGELKSILVSTKISYVPINLIIFSCRVLFFLNLLKLYGSNCFWALLNRWYVLFVAVVA